MTIVYGDALACAQRDATANVPGQFAYTPPSETILNASANQPLGAAFIPSDTVNCKSTTIATIITVSPAPLAVSANNAVRAYGASNPSFSGSIKGAVNDGNFTESFTTTATSTSAPGTYPIVPATAGADLGNYTQTISNGVLAVTQAATATMLSSISSSPASAGQAVTFTANVTSATSGTPTGSVTFACSNYASGQSIDPGPIPLAGGTAVWTTSSLPAFAYSNCFTATYSGDTNFQASVSSPAQSLTVTDFQLSLSPTSLNLSPGSSASFNVTVQPLDGAYNDMVQLTVTGLPNGVSAKVNPSSVTPGANSATVNVTLTDTNLALGTQDRKRGAMPLILALLLPLIGLRLRAPGWFWRVISLPVLALAAMLALNACSGGGLSKQPPQTCTVTVTGTSGTAQHSGTINLTVE